MIRLPGHVLTADPQHGRDELAAAWAHLVAAAEHGAKQVGEASRQRGALARDRAAAAGAALRGELPVSRWRWVGLGVAAGVVIGAVGAALARHRCTPDQSEPGPEQAVAAGVRERASAVRERASTAVAEVREQASAAVHGAASAVQGAAAAARNTIDKVREKAADDPDDGPQPPSQPS